MNLKNIVSSFGLLLLFLAGSAQAQNILLYNQQCNGSTAYFPAALIESGFAFTETNDDGAFANEFTSGVDWDLVIVDQYAATISNQNLADLEAYIVGGGRLIISYFNWDEPSSSSLIGALGAGFNASFNSPQQIFVYEPGHPLFNGVGDLNPTDDTCVTDDSAFMFTASTALAGYTQTVQQGQAAVILGNQDRTLLFGSTPGLFNGDDDGDTVPDMQEFAVNAVQFMLGVIQEPVPVVVPTLSKLSTLLLISLLLLLVWQQRYRFGG